MTFEELVAQLYHWKVYLGTEEQDPRPSFSSIPPIPEHNPTQAKRIYSWLQLTTAKEFHERMDRLQSWINNTWNNENPRYQVQLKPANREQTEYYLTPLGYEKYIMLDFTQQETEPKYRLYINLARSKRYFHGIERFQRFFENVVTLLKPPSPLTGIDAVHGELRETKRRLSCPY